MTDHSPLYVTPLFRRANKANISQKLSLDYTWADFRLPLLFMFCCSLFGLHFYPAVLIIVAMIFHAYRKDRYNCAIMVTLFLGGFGLTRLDILPVKLYDIGLMLSVFAILVLKKSKVERKILFCCLAYIALIIYISTFSQEKFSIQITIMRQYFSVISVFVPLMIFANHQFDVMLFFRKLMVFVLIMCAFYVVDAFILKGWFLLPGTHSYAASYFYSPNIAPFSLTPVRKYPQGLIFIALAIVPIMRYFTLKKWQILLIFIAVICTRTFSLMAGIGVCMILFQSSRWRILKFGVIGVAALSALYIIDSYLPITVNEVGVESTLRIKSSLDQFVALKNATDDVDVAEFGSGRMSQAMPILELIDMQDSQWTGLGFLHPEHTKITNLIIWNEYFSDVTQAERVATDVEIVQMQVFIHMGWAGVILQTVFFLTMCLLIWRMKYRAYYYCVLVFCFILGLAGFSSVNTYTGGSMLGLALAVVILAQKEVGRKSLADDRSDSVLRPKFGL